MFLPHFRHLEEGEIAGQETINPILDLLEGMRSDSDFLDLNANGIGGVTFSFNEGVLYNWLAKALQRDSLDHSFKGAVEGSSVSVSGGTVHLEHNAIYLSPLAATECTDGGTVYAVVDSISSGALVYSGDSSDSALEAGIVQPAAGGHENRLVLPIMRTIEASGVFALKYFHIGDFFFASLPYFWISNYNKGKHQSLDHAANADGYAWTDYGVCP